MEEKCGISSQAIFARQALSNYHFTFDDVRKQIGAGFGADGDEIYLASDTTDGVCAVLAGLALNRGDEILTTNMEHPAAATPMTVLRDRRGVVIKQVPLPFGPRQRAEDFVIFLRQAGANSRSTGWPPTSVKGRYTTCVSGSTATLWALGPAFPRARLPNAPLTSKTATSPLSDAT